MAPKRTKLLNKDSVVKSLKGFVKDEDGFVSKETILKVGLATVAGLAAFGTGTAEARPVDHYNHANNIATSGTCFQHGNAVSHVSY